MRWKCEHNKTCHDIAFVKLNDVKFFGFPFDFVLVEKFGSKNKKITIILWTFIL